MDEFGVDNCPSYFITDKCGICAYLYPLGAIYEGKDAYIVDKTRCARCGECE